jgi:hypothetical protein
MFNMITAMITESDVIAITTVKYTPENRRKKLSDNCHKHSDILPVSVAVIYSLKIGQNKVLITVIFFSANFAK